MAEKGDVLPGSMLPVMSGEVKAWTLGDPSFGRMTVMELEKEAEVQDMKRRDQHADDDKSEVRVPSRACIICIHACGTIEFSRSAALSTSAPGS